MTKTYYIFSEIHGKGTFYVAFDKENNAWLTEFMTRDIAKLLIHLRTLPFLKHSDSKTDVVFLGDNLLYYPTDDCFRDYKGKFKANPLNTNRKRALKEAYKIIFKFCERRDNCGKS